MKYNFLNFKFQIFENDLNGNLIDEILSDTYDYK